MRRLLLFTVLQICLYDLRAEGLNVLTPAEQTAGWKLLFDGKSLDGWMWSTSPNPPQPSWTVEDGALRTTPGQGKEVYLLTRESFRDFEFAFEWKAEAKANSGIKYRFQGYGGKQGGPSPDPVEDGGRIEPIGLEYQIADDAANPDAVSDPKHATAAVYEYWPAKKPSLAGPDVWHRGRIVVDGLHVQHWLDGVKVVDIRLTDPEVIESFGKSPRKRSAALFLRHERRSSPIALQMHDHTVWFRNLRIRALSGGAGE